MLKYEEKLHFDAHYRPLQNGRRTAARRLVPGWRAGSGSGCYILTVLRRQVFAGFVIRPAAFGGMRLRMVGPVPFTQQQDAVYFCVGLLLFAGAGPVLAVPAASAPARSSRRAAPKRRWTSGPYAKTRHPMYGAFILLQGGFLPSLRTRSGLLLALLVAALQYFNAIWEERHILAPQFGAAYETYRAQVPHLLFRPWQAALLLLAALFSIAGFAA